jgi:hypothetical protein
MKLLLRILWWALKRHLHVVSDEGVVLVDDSPPGTFYQARRLWLEKEYPNQGSIRMRVDVDVLLLDTCHDEWERIVMLVHEIKAHLKAGDMMAKDEMRK